MFLYVYLHFDEDECDTLAKHHKKIHLKEVVDKTCPLCGVVTACLKRHMLCHQTEKKFSCSMCGQKAKRREHVKQHIRGKQSQCSNADVLVDESIKYWRQSENGRPMPEPKVIVQQISKLQTL